MECNNTTYYYENKNDFTINDYSINDHYLYNTISYSIFEGDYCLLDKLNYYSGSLGGLMRFHTLNGGKISLYDDSLEIPEESGFKLDDGKMILVDNYFSDYYADEIVLK